ncbi:MAG: hypothetical protein EOP08_03965 [Proteobacteria bacterium]|nr:MAG: hypothetical protein EOP08_03965 [Pseudomonadota bacterium]
MGERRDLGYAPAPMKCEHCGAVVAVSALVCSFCQAPTLAGRRAHEQAEYAAREQARLHAAHEQQARMAAQLRLQSLSTHSMWWSGAGLIVCCLPVAALGIVQGLRARGLARTLGAVVPTGATVGLALGAFGSLASVGVWTWAIIASNQDEAEAAAKAQTLEAQAKPGSEATVLSRETACALAEAYTWKAGFDDVKGYRMKHPECLGKVTVDGDRAVLDDWRFAHTTTRYDVNVCFKRGGRWYVSEMKKGACWEGAAPGAASSASTPTLTPAGPKRRAVEQ